MTPFRHSGPPSSGIRPPGGSHRPHPPKPDEQVGVSASTSGVPFTVRRPPPSFGHLPGRDVLDSRHAGHISLMPPSVRQVRILIWVYFWLLIFEGALRKWVVPALNEPLLLVRDPVAILIYIQALRGGFFQKTGWTMAIVGLGALTTLWGIGQSYGGDWKDFVVVAYGVRTYFLHLPLIFIMGYVFTAKDVLKLGRWVLILSIPMAGLMVLQYQSAPDSFLNRGTVAKEGMAQGGQLMAALGKIRPAGTFSFITGPATFYPLVCVFLCLGIVYKRLYPTWLVLAAAGATLLMLPVSGSRTLVLACAGVGAAMAVALIFNPRSVPRFALLGIVAAALGVGLLATPVGKQAIESFSTRWTAAAQSEGQGKGAVAAISTRMGGAFTEVFEYLPYVPFGGMGIGVGTNVGAKLKTGGIGVFMAGEHEWTRNVFECGVLLGFSYIGFRVILALSLLKRSFGVMRRGNFLPWLLMSTAFLNLVYGQTQQPTLLGFMVFTAGLSVAAVRHGHESLVVEKPRAGRRRPVADGPVEGGRFRPVTRSNATNVAGIGDKID